MAQNTIFSGRQFQVYVNNDDTTSGVGTLNALTNATWKQIDVDSVSFPSFSPIQEFEMRTGSGRVAEFDNVYTTDKRVTTEFSLSGRVDHILLPILVESVTGIAAASDKVTIASGYEPASLLRAASVAEGDYEKSLSFYFAAPTNSDSYKLKGCVCTSLTLSADMDTASGRFQFDATFQTQDPVSKGAISTTNFTGLGSRNQCYLSDMTTKSITLAGSVSESAIDALWTSCSFSIEQPTQFLGTTGTDAECEVIARGLPETVFTMSGTVKYDANTDQIVESFRAANSDNAVAIHIANDPENSNTFSTSATSIGFDINKGKFTSAEVNPDDLAMVSFEVKALDDGTNPVAAILIA